MICIRTFCLIFILVLLSACSIEGGQGRNRAGNEIPKDDGFDSLQTMTKEGERINGLMSEVSRDEKGDFWVLARPVTEGDEVSLDFSALEALTIKSQEQNSGRVVTGRDCQEWKWTGPVTRCGPDPVTGGHTEKNCETRYSGRECIRGEDIWYETKSWIAGAPFWIPITFGEVEESLRDGLVFELLPLWPGFSGEQVSPLRCRFSDLVATEAGADRESMDARLTFVLDPAHCKGGEGMMEGGSYRLRIFSSAFYLTRFRAGHTAKHSNAPDEDLTHTDYYEGRVRFEASARIRR